MQRADPLAFRQAASRFATGVAVLTALDSHGEVCGMTANSFVTISLSPPTVLVSVKPGRMHEAMSASRRYGVNVLPEQAKALSRLSRAGRARHIPITKSSKACRGCRTAWRFSPAR
jgi:flavin reductase (DIM6/NTAB) family NADH-FMN oxidoreductase RutF